MYKQSVLAEASRRLKAEEIVRVTSVVRDRANLRRKHNPRLASIQYHFLDVQAVQLEI